MGRLGDGGAAAPTVAWTAPPTIGRAVRLRGDREPAVVAAPGRVTPDGTYWIGPGVIPTAAATRSSGPAGGVGPRSAGKGRASPGGGWVRPAATVLLDNPNIPAVAGRRPR
ncbi:hypothetical protein [Streptomyces sp. LN500]|uniref:hypothetical protein n=1 Tax=Streptomyces sp. LN500 TaxID=3112978 RepID=UPI003720587B